MMGLGVLVVGIRVEGLVLFLVFGCTRLIPRSSPQVALY